jgi:hypothetical protein
MVSSVSPPYQRKSLLKPAPVDRESEAADDSGKQVDSAAETALALVAFDERVREEIGRQQATAQERLREGALTEEALVELFGHAVRGALATGRTLQEADTECTRKQLKAQACVFALKLETSRTASAVQLETAKVEMEAVHQKALVDKVRALSSNEGALLAEAHAQNDELQKQVSGLNMKASMAEEKLVSTGKLLRGSEVQVAKAQTELHKLRAEADAAQAALATALESFEGTRSQNQTLAEHR